MECPGCGGETPADRRFCTRCGAVLPAAACGLCHGVSPPGSAFCADCGADLRPAAVAADPADQATGPPVRPPPLRRPEAERRQLTVLFCDLVGSTALSARLDPEDLREVIRGYHQCVTEVVERFEGHVAKYLGDGVLAYFGYPQAHEDDAERAVRAGLRIVETVGPLRSMADVRLRVRVGIATGLVVVGELLDAGATREQVAVGETPNLAARLQAIAEPDSVVIAESTRRLVEGLFVGVEYGVHRLDGFAEPVRAWRPLRANTAEGRFAALHASGLPPLVGREQELALLLDRWERAKEGEGQVVLLAGEPGIGKSHLTEALRQRLEGDEPHTRLRHVCSPFHQNSVLHPIIDQLERAAGFQREDTAEVRLTKLEALLARGAEREHVVAIAPLFADLLAIPTGDRYPPAEEIGPERRKERLFEALVAQLEGLAARQPVLDVFEDAHWIDPTSQELLGRIVDRVQRLRVLEVITFRPEFQPPWCGYGHVTLLTLNRLGRRHVAAIIERATGGRALPSEVLEQIVAKTDGVPLFVEELTKAVLESGMLREEEGRYELAGPLPPLAIPATLQDSLMARLDRLAPVKEVAQIGAAIGREFAHELLAAVAPLGEARLRAALDQLVESELVFRRGVPPEATYSFKHVLVRDAAYESLLTSKRQRLHARIAQALEERFPETAAIEPELLARHYTEAGLTGRAVAYWYRAGRRASERSANAEAVAHLTRGLELVKGLPEPRERARWELALNLTLGPVLMNTRGWSAPEVERAYLRARELWQEVDEGESGQLFTVTWGLWLVYQQRAELRTARGLLGELFALAERQHADPALLLQAHHAAWTTYFALPDLERARRHAEEGLALYDVAKHHRDTFVYGGHDTGACGLYNLAMILWCLGYPDQAVARADEAIGLARRIGHSVSLAFALTYAALVHQYRREAHLTRERAAEASRLCTEQGIVPHCAAAAAILHGWAVAAEGRPNEGLAAIRRGLEAVQATGVVLRRPYYLALLAEACERAGRVDEGLDALAEALSLIEENDQRRWEAEVHRMRGELLLARAPEDRTEAEACFHRAIAVARDQGAKSLELRAALSLCRLWHGQGERDAARDLLVPIHAWFTEGFATADLKEARALLDSLA